MVSGFCHFGLVYSWFCDRTLTLPSCLVSCERAASSVLKPCALSSACFVSCWSVVFGSLHSSCSGSVLVSCRGSDTHAPCSVLLWERAGLEFARALRSSVHGCCVLFGMCFGFGRMLFHYLVVLHAARFSAVCFLLFVMFCVNTWLMSVVISCVSVSCFAHG